MSETKPAFGELRYEMHPTGARAEIVTNVPTPSGKGGYRIIARTSDMADAKAWAQRIVTAVNAHDDLLKACKAVKAYTDLDDAEATQDQLKTTVDLLLSALAKAEPPNATPAEEPDACPMCGGPPDHCSSDCEVDHEG